MNRRQFISLAAGGLAANLLAPSSPAQTRRRARFQGVVFDAFPIFDPRPVFAAAEEIFPGHGQELSSLWRSRQFEYTWLRTLAHRYADFERTMADALTFAVRALRLSLSHADRERLLGAYFQLKAWPDIRPALDALKAAGIWLGFLSNFTRRMLEANIASSGLHGYFERILSTDQAGAFKPDPRAYQLGPAAFGLAKEELVFAAYAGWDAAGAKAFGYPTFWINRQDAPAEELPAPPDAMGTIGGLVPFILGQTG